MSPSTRVRSCFIIPIFYICTFATFKLFSRQLLVTNSKEIHVNTGLISFFSSLRPFIIIRILAYLLIGTPPEGKFHAVIHYSD